MTIIQNLISVIRMIPLMAEMGEMANHGGSAAAMVNIGHEKGHETEKR